MMTYNVFMGVIVALMVLVVVAFVFFLKRSVQMRDRVNQWPKSAQVVGATLGTIFCGLLLWALESILSANARESQITARNWLSSSTMKYMITPEMKQAAVKYAADSMRFARVELALMWIIPIICVAIGIGYGMWLRKTRAV